MTDPDMREHAQKLRGNLRFLTLRELAAIVGLVDDTIRFRIRDGSLPALRRDGNPPCYVVRSDRIDAIRNYQPKPHTGYRRFEAWELAIMRERCADLTARELGELFDRKPQVIMWKARQLGLVLKPGDQSGRLNCHSREWRDGVNGRAVEPKGCLVNGLAVEPKACLVSEAST